MRRALPSSVLAILVMSLMGGGAIGASPYAGCPVGPGGAGNSAHAYWELMDEPTFADKLAGDGFDPAEAELVYAAGDKNGDGLLCVMVQTLPNDASGSDTWLVSRDNNAREK